MIPAFQVVFKKLVMGGIVDLFLRFSGQAISQQTAKAKPVWRLENYRQDNAETKLPNALNERTLRSVVYRNRSLPLLQFINQIEQTFQALDMIEVIVGHDHLG
jgi:hypothetical protein